MSTKRFTKELRQQIVEAFARRHNGQYSPELFLKEVSETGKDHPAFGWFEWKNDKAANEHRLWQARAFAKDLRVTFTVEEVGRGGEVTVKTTEMPVVLSPVAGRSSGGGYVLADPNDPVHMAEHCHQAAAALRAWIRRYEAAIIHAGAGLKVIESVAQTLDEVSPPKAEEAA